MSTIPIADYALLSDRHSAALVSRDGSIDWLCFPRFDSPSVFGRLLGDEAGHWSIRATKATQVTRRYLDRTMVLETTFRTPTGTVTITDALAMGDGNRGHDLGRGAPHAPAAPGHVRRRRGRSVRGVRPASGVRAGPSAVRCRRRWSGRVRGRRRGGALFPGGPDRRPVGGLRPAPAPPRRERQLRPSSQQAGRDRLGPGLDPARDRDTVGRHRVGVGVLVGAPSGLCGSVARPGAPQRTGTPVTLLCTHRRHLRGGDHVAARGGGGRPKLGLPLRLGPRRLLHDRGPLGGGLPRRGQSVLRLHDLVGGRLTRPGRRSADHVRGRWRTGPDRAGAAAPGGLAALRCPFGSATAPGTSANSTSTANCSAPWTASRTNSSTTPPDGSGRWPTRTSGVHHPIWHQPPDGSSSNWPTPPPGVGRKRTRGSGRSAASPATTCTRS